jgi:hypothetical protein
MKHGHNINQTIVHDYVRWCKMLIYVHIEIHQYMAWQINLYVCNIQYNRAVFHSSGTLERMHKLGFLCFAAREKKDFG